MKSDNAGIPMARMCGGIVLAVCVSLFIVGCVWVEGYPPRQRDEIPMRQVPEHIRAAFETAYPGAVVSDVYIRRFKGRIVAYFVVFSIDGREGLEAAFSSDGVELLMADPDEDDWD